jgi:hypothetical protein
MDPGGVRRPEVKAAEGPYPGGGVGVAAMGCLVLAAGCTSALTSG